MTASESTGGSPQDSTDPITELALLADAVARGLVRVTRRGVYGAIRGAVRATVRGVERAEKLNDQVDADGPEDFNRALGFAPGLGRRDP